MAQIARAARFAIATVPSRSGLRASRALMRGSAELGVMPVTSDQRCHAGDQIAEGTGRPSWRSDQDAPCPRWSC